VGLPLALAFGRQNIDTIGFDIDQRRIDDLEGGVDSHGEVAENDFADLSLSLTSEPEDLERATFYVVTVPTPIDQAHQPDLSILKSACKSVGEVLSAGDIVVFESTVYPGVTRDICGPILAEVSGLKQDEDFGLGYSPERINPGDKKHRLETITKVVAGDSEESLERIAPVYEAVVEAGVYRAQSLEVAEAAKVIENTQRDLNIALMNELAIIFDRLGLRTRDVLDAAETKWNFLGFHPGLVGGHCIGVDPYYLTHKSESVGYHPEIILAGRRINDRMGTFVAQKAVKLLIETDRKVQGATIGLLGLTFKENVSDLRNSRVPEIVDELADFGISCKVHDPRADREDAKKFYDIDLVELEDMTDLDGLIVAVAHDSYRDMPQSQLEHMVGEAGFLIDVKSMIEPSSLDEDVVYWSL
jgi:UDP-N-acetyl-D-galactosamine dehydrogenase